MTLGGSVFRAPMTVVFTDVCGSTKMRTRLGDRRADEILDAVRDAVRDETTRRDGRIVQDLGDGHLVVFASPRDAVEFGISLQRRLGTEKFASADVAMRIGMNTGEVIDQGDEVRGEAVHAASRINSIAGPGEVLVAEVVKQLVGTIPGVTFTDRGARELKGFPEAFRLFAVVGPVEEPVRVVIAEDSVLLRQGIVRVVRDAGYAVVGEAGDAQELLELVQRERPQLVITDIRMPPDHTDEGLRAAVKIRRDRPKIAIVVLSQYVESGYADELLQEGSAIAYLLKDRVTHVREFQAALQRVVNGDVVVDPEVVRVLVEQSRRDDPLDALSAREKEVLTLMAEGRSNTAIGEGLFLSPRTVESHVKSIFNKLGLVETPDDHRRVLAVITYLRSLMSATGAR